MSYTDYELERIYRKTEGYCHLCDKKIAYKNYGLHDARGAWHVDHSVPKAKGGTDHFNNLYPACIPCNLFKGSKSNRQVRNELKGDNSSNSSSLVYPLLGIGIGAMFGPVGAMIGGIIGNTLKQDDADI